MSLKSLENGLAVRWVPAIAVLTMLLATADADATFPGRNGRIAFAALRDPPIGHVIYTINPNGTDQRRLAHGTTPSYSPDGRKIVYAAHRGGDWEIFTMRANGTHQRQITQNRDLEDIEPSYSPDGKEIVFSRTLPTGFEIFKMRSNGTRQRQLTLDSNQEGATGAIFSPDGTRIIYTQPSFNSYRASSLFHMRTDGTFQRRFSLGYSPDYSPDGRYIVVDGTNSHSHNSIVRMDADGSHFEYLSPWTPAIRDTDPAFSPNAKRVVWSRDGSLFKMRWTGAQPRRLTRPPQSSSGSGQAVAGDFAPDWQPRRR
jgi:Tol biopolymer transport system component